jgi:hypothetical protein
MSKPVRNTAFFIGWVLFCIVLFECAYYGLFRVGVIHTSPSIFIQEETEDTIRFDAVRGYKISPDPARMARITDGSIEFSGVLQGNNEGFPDKHDFFPKRKDPDTIRIAVFGDSFTAAQYIRVSWPDRVEEFMNVGRKKVELLNFSVDGAGLANWWSILIRLVKEEEYELDGIIFAVLDGPIFGDLYRGFTVSDHRDSVANIFRYRDWHPGNWPKTFEEAEPFLEEQPIHIVSQKQFDAALQGKWNPEWPSPFKLDAVRQLYSLVVRVKSSSRIPYHRNSFGIGQKRLTQEMLDFCDQHQLRKMVISIPRRESLVNAIPISDDLREFAGLLNAEVVDGRDAFKHKGEHDVLKDFFPYDGHWNQFGSDRFATFMKSEIQKTYRDSLRD